MFRVAVFLAACLVAQNAWAQQAPEAPSPPASAPLAKAVIPMEEPLPGDHWTHEIRDQISGKITATRDNIITEVTPTSISVRFDRIGGNTNEHGFTVYDRLWNVTEERPWRFSPSDGSGIQTPLEVGKTWPLQTNNVNSANGSVWRRSGAAKVIGQEAITTKAGTFETFKIEIKLAGKNVNNPLVKNDVMAMIWYAPAIDHWVKRTLAVRTNKHLEIDRTIELIEYGRKQ